MTIIICLNTKNVSNKKQKKKINFCHPRLKLATALAKICCALHIVEF